MTEHKDYLVSKVSMVVTNAQELIDITEKAQQQSAELQKTLTELESWQPNLQLEERAKPLNDIDKDNITKMTNPY